MAEPGSGLSAGWVAALTAGTALVGALAGFGGAYATGYFSLASKNEELHVHLVEIAIGILRADPKEGVAPARDWAIKIIEKNSGENFSPEDRAALLHKPILSKELSWSIDKDTCKGLDSDDCLRKVLGDVSNTPPK
jgi:hypothetical protein